MRWYKFSLQIIALCGLALITGCATGGSSLNARVERNEQQIQRLLSQVGQVEQVLPGQAEMWSQMQAMRQEVNMLTGKIDDIQLNTTGGGEAAGELARLRERVSRLETVIRQMASQLAVNVDVLNAPDAAPYYVPPRQITPGTTSAIPGPAGKVTPPPTADNAAALYESGIKAFDQRRYKDAVVNFKDFSAKYPKHQLAGNSHFWEGESHFQLKDYPRAVLAYQDVITKFPGSPKLQSAMLKQGISLYHANKKPAAKERLQDLVARYPNSPEASRAKQFMAQNK